MTPTAVPRPEGPTLSIQLPTFAAEDPGGWEPLLALARTADGAGVDGVVVSDHVVFGEQLDAYGDPSTGGTAGGRQPTGPDGHWLEPLTVLAVIAGQTSRVRLGTAILLAALRRPAVLAKQLATLDVVSGGRLDIGVGVGWQREEYEASGLAFERRGALLDHTVAVCQRLWRDDVVDFADDELSFERIHAMPKPVQAGGVPIWVSGRMNPRTVRRVVGYGSGWIPWGDDVADPGPGVRELRTALERAGRDPGSLQVQGTIRVVRTDGVVDLDATLAPVADLVAAGVTDVRLSHRWLADPAADADLLAGVVPAFRSLVGRPAH